MYHGTNFDFDIPRQGIWLTESKHQAEAHGRHVKVFYIKPKNVIDLRKPEEREYKFNAKRGEPDFMVEHIKGFQESPSWRQITGKVYTEKEINGLCRKRKKGKS